jgi:diguanylate cyclase (GGDEF)-like protein
LSRIASFKVKLVLWFALLALLPLAVAFFEYGRLVQRSETRRADAALHGDLQTAFAGLSARLDGAALQARALASEPALQKALRDRDRAGVAAALRRSPDAAVYGRGFHVGSNASPNRMVAVLSGKRTIGRVYVRVPLDRATLQQLAVSFPPGDTLILAPKGVATSMTYRGTKYRAMASPPFAALTPQHAIDSAIRRSLEIFVGVLLGLLAAMVLATYLLGSSIVRSLRRLVVAAQALASGDLEQRVYVHGRDEFARVAWAFNEMALELEQRLTELERERRRTREAHARFGAALAATLDPVHLLHTVLATAVEEAGAAGGMVMRDGEELARVGRPDRGVQRIAFPLRAGENDFGSLVLTGEGFDEEQIETVAALAAQATVGLENARLHGIVERQALLDGLTGLANRRSADEKLRTEVARARRFDDTVCLVLADLDDFKNVNDTFGHPTGDEALRLFAATLSATVREIDVAARWGGEEFALILPGTDAEGGARLAERARDALERCALRVDGREVQLTASFGVASLPPADDVEELIVAADAALYEAKRTGKNRVMV